MVYFPFDQLSFHFSCACTIELEDKVIVTGGVPYPQMGQKVVEYNAYGWVKDLPDLNEKRGYHGCGHYVDNNNNMVNILNYYPQRAQRAGGISKGLVISWS